MLIKFIAVLFILTGIAGLVLPIVPGILLITVGVLLFFRDKTARIREMLPEKMPPLAAGIYSRVLPKILSPYYKIIANETALAQGAKLLDVGTGPGILALEIASKFPSSQITGIDISEKMVEIANNNRINGTVPAGRKIDNVEFKLMDAKRLEFSDEYFDLILSTGSFHHWKDPMKVIGEIHRCLKKGSEAWIYDGFSETANEDVARCVKKIWNIFPTAGIIRYALSIHGYCRKEYEAIVSGILHKTPFKEVVLEPKGIMMRMRLKKA